MAMINSIKVNGATHTFTLPYGTCSTAAGTVAKTVDVDNFSLETGARVLVKFTVTNSASNPTLNVESTGAKSIMYRGEAISAGRLAANRVYEFVYDGTDWELVGDLDTTYSFSGGNPTLSWGATSTIGTAGGATYKVTMPGNPNTDSKVTSVGNHYSPSADSNSALSVDANSNSAASWGTTSLVTGVNLSRDAKGHVTGITVDSKRMPGNPNTDTKNTTGALDTNSKIYLVGAKSQDANPVTWSHDTAYVGTDGCLYSGGLKVATAEGVTAQIQAAIDDLIDGAPGTLQTLNAIAAALGDDANLAATLTKEINKRVSKVDTGVQSIAGGLVIGGTSATATGKGRIMITGAGNPLIGLQAVDAEGNQLTPYYFQVSNDIMYLGPTSSKALQFDRDGNTGMPGNLTVAGSLSVTGSITEGSTKLSDKYAPKSHKHAASDITSGALPIARGGTGATTAAAARLALEAMPALPTSIELNQNGSLSGYGGFIDFHYNGSSADYTSRIIEGPSGKLTFYAPNGISSDGTITAPAFSGNGSSLTALNASNITSGTLSSNRLPVVPISKGGTGADNKADALANLGINLNNYLPLSGGTITGKLTVNNAVYIAGGRYYGTGDDEGVIIGPASNGYAGLILGSNTGSRSVFYLKPEKTAVWRWGKEDGSSTDIAHPGKNGTIALTSDIPSVGNGTLTIQRNGSNLGTFTANQSSNTTINISVPTATSQLTNNSGFVTASNHTHSYLPLSGGTLTGNLEVTGTVKIGNAVTLKYDSTNDCLDFIF